MGAQGSQQEAVHGGGKSAQPALGRQPDGGVEEPVSREGELMDGRARARAHKPDSVLAHARRDSDLSNH